MSLVLVGNLKVTRGTTAERTAITPEAGALIFDTDLKKVFVGDGSTVGGLDVGAAGATFVGLADVPASYAGAAGKTVVVKTTEDGLEFDAAPGGGMANPMTTAGDMIVGGAAGAPARLAVGDANTVLHGGATPGYGAIAEADLSLADNTTANVSATKHGFAPKAPADATKYLDGSGAWSVPAAGRDTITALTNSAGVVNVDLSLGDYFTLLGMAANVTSLTFTNLPAAGKARTIDITVSQDATGSRTFALPASFKAIGSSDTAIQSAASAKTKIIATTLDAGTTWAYSMAKVAP